MKKLEKDFLNKFQNTIIKQDKVVNNTKIFKKGLIISLSSLFLAAVIIIPISINFAFPNTVKNTSVFPSNETIEYISILNKNEINKQYGLSDEFNSENIKINIGYKDGTVSLAKKDSYVIDYYLFNNQLPGTYTISIYLKDEPAINTSFEVEVIDARLESVTLDSYRPHYFLNENLDGNNDVYILKTYTNGTKIRASYNEYEIDYSKVDTSKEGTYPIYVKYDEDTSFSYDVNVSGEFKASSLDLAGNYYINNDFINYTYPPQTLAMNISLDENNNFIINSYYSELALSGILNIYLNENGKVEINNTMTYDIFNKTFYSKGLISSDPYFYMYKIDENKDYFIGVDSDLLDEKFIAFDGHLTLDTYYYLYQTFVEVYLDKNKNYPLLPTTTFTKDSILYVGIKQSIDVSDIISGTYYDQYNIVYCVIEEDKIYYRSRYYDYDIYQASIDDDGNISIVVGFTRYVYDLKNNTLKLVYAFEPVESDKYIYNKMDETQACVTFDESLALVVDKGTILKDYIIKPDEAIFLEFISYDNSPILQDCYVDSLIGRQYLFDIFGRYGTLDNYLIIKNAWSVSRSSMDGHSYYLVWYKNYEVYDIGWIRFSDYINGEYIMAVDFESNPGHTTYIKHKFNHEFSFGDGTNYLINNQIFKDLDEILGTYIDENGEYAYIDIKGNLGIHKVNSSLTSCSITYKTLTPYIIDYENHNYVFSYSYQNAMDELEIHYARVYLDENNTFTIEYEKRVFKFYSSEFIHDCIVIQSFN